MGYQLIDGRKIAENIKNQIKGEVAVLTETGTTPSLAVVLCGKDPASAIYVNSKKKACEYVGIRSVSYEFDEHVTEKEILDLIEELNNDKTINGILVQLPLPGQISEKKVIRAISPEKDVDGFHPVNAGLLGGGDGFIPCTPAGIIELIKSLAIPISGMHCVIIGRSGIVGKPVASLMLNENATVTICHSKTENLSEITRTADIIIAAAGNPQMLTVDMIKEGAILIDVGINRLPSGKLCGDIDFEGCAVKCAAITPVPGGVGPMTIAMLMKNCVLAYKKQT